MPDLWIDEHLGDEAVARPDFRADLRATLATELDGRRAPWRRIAWAVAAAAAVIAVVYVVTKDDEHTLQPATSNATTTTVELPDPALAQVLPGARWYVVSMDGEPVTNGARFELQANGALVGFDGCNGYSIDEGIADGWSLNGRTIRVPGMTSYTLNECPGVDAVAPLADGSELSLDGDTLIITNDHAYEASTEPTLPLAVDIPATGGPEVAVTSLSTVPMTSFDPPVVALMGEVITVLLVRDGGLSGDVLLYDLDGTYLRTATIFAHPVRPIWVGGDLYALWMAIQPTPDADIELARYNLDGDLFVRSGPNAVVGPTSLDGRRLHVNPERGVGGDDGLPFVSAGPPLPGAHAAIVPWAAGTLATVRRTETYGPRHTWEVRTTVDPTSPPTETILAVPYGDGVVLHGATSASGDGFLAWLRPDGEPTTWGRLGDWSYADANTSTVIVTRMTDNGLEIGIALPS